MFADLKDQLRDLFLYGGADSYTYRKVYDEITASNRRNLSVFTLIATWGMVVMLIASLFDETLVKNRVSYLVCLIISMALYLIAERARKASSVVIYACMYTFVALLLAFGIALGTFVEPNEVSVSFPILLFAVPLFFTDIPFRMNIASVLGIIAYTCAAMVTQDRVMLGYNMSNILPYGAISIILCDYMTVIKVRRYALEDENRYLIESDQLTGLLNRHCYEQHLAQLRKLGIHDGCLMCAFDLNGLKMVNDNLGHHAGDELLRGAANCIQGVFGRYGRCYRVGGDEFMAILDTAAPAQEELREELENRCACFKGTYVSGLSISVGMVRATAGSSVSDMIKQADKAMYEDKALYYQRTKTGRT